MRDGVMVDDMRQCFILLKIGAKSFGTGIQDICKISVSNFGTIRWLLRLKIIQKQEFVCLRADFQIIALSCLSALFFVSLYYVALRGSFFV